MRDMQLGHVGTGVARHVAILLFTIIYYSCRRPLKSVPRGRIRSRDNWTIEARNLSRVPFKSDLLPCTKRTLLMERERAPAFGNYEAIRDHFFSELVVRRQ